MVKTTKGKSAKANKSHNVQMRSKAVAKPTVAIDDTVNRSGLKSKSVKKRTVRDSVSCEQLKVDDEVTVKWPKK